MRLTEAHNRLKRMNVPSFTTNDAAFVLGVDRAHASKILSRLHATDHVKRLQRGRWTVPEHLHPLLLPETLTAPLPSYISLYSALYHHGVIEQIPEITYAVTLGPTRKIVTPLGSVSLHRVAPAFFTGFEIDPKSGAKIATIEKALMDALYLRPAKSRLFRAFPELEFPRRFSRRRARGFLQRIHSEPRRSMVAKELEAILAEC